MLIYQGLKGENRKQESRFRFKLYTMKFVRLDEFEIPKKTVQLFNRQFDSAQCVVRVV
jgi:hypothetical protein